MKSVASIEDYRFWLERVLESRAVSVNLEEEDSLEDYMERTYWGTNLILSAEVTPEGFTVYELHDPYETEEYFNIARKGPDALALKNAVSGVVAELVHGERYNPYHNEIRAMWMIHAYGDSIAEYHGIPKPGIISLDDSGDGWVTLKINIDDEGREDDATSALGVD